MGAVEESNVQVLHSQEANTVAHIKSTNLIACISAPLYKSIQTLDSRCGLTNLTGSGTSYFVPGKVERTPALFLFTIGAFINVLLKRKFDQVLPNVKQALTPVNISGTLADGLKLPFLATIVASGRLRQLPFEAVFYVADIEQDAFLGMDFFTH